jgi:hypothetical protein
MDVRSDSDRRMKERSVQISFSVGVWLYSGALIQDQIPGKGSKNHEPTHALKMYDEVAIDVWDYGAVTQPSYNLGSYTLATFTTMYVRRRNRSYRPSANPQQSGIGKRYSTMQIFARKQPWQDLRL